jgi:hypothetical protein
VFGFGYVIISAANWFTRPSLFHESGRVIACHEFAAAQEAARRTGSGTRVMLMDTTAAMLLRPDGHPSRYRHWALEKVTL